jgi:hypothetical protein
MNKNMFVSKMKLFGDTQSVLAELLGMSLSRLNAKINETNGSQFRMYEIKFFRDRWHLTPEEVDQIFFASEVPCGGTANV